ncbi:TPA: protein-L-isoaspartate(D-aspartate) O-methyltransferase [Candidatus Woesearchaeota archaeon]|nr:protein-L-isoaspartate(D-aspartate) O-methyltransferase [Candidatus Woesearchaeota archaeon]
MQSGMVMDGEALQEKQERLIAFWKSHQGMPERELSAFRNIKREHFVPKNLAGMAYDDQPLPLLRGKTISQPTTVMIMTRALEIEPGDIIYEIGTGSGYQAAILGYLAGIEGSVTTTEVIPELVEFARINIMKAGLHNIHISEEDGSRGRPGAEFDKIILTAAAREFPKELIAQLKTGGIIIGPIGDAMQQDMVRGIKREDGSLSLDFLGPYVFTPMYGRYGFME